ncbi:MAG: glycosyltransferase [Methylacidiphilales bacterium]|nr:glycosyltransferase [Candidatus Methylacidiphilales bacterium]
MKEWFDLFHPVKGISAPVRVFTLLTRGKIPILWLPEDRQMADATLRLYPPQTLLARALIRLLRACLWMGIRIPFQTTSIPIDENTAIAGFLKSLAPDSPSVPPFGVLSGNIKTVGRRYSLLLFDAAGKPAVVVKLGVSEKARQLIRAEQEFFFPKGPAFPGLPDTLAIYDGQDASAIAYRYVEGSSPIPQQSGEIAAVLNSWIYDSEPVPIAHLPIWARLQVLNQENPGLNSVFKILQNNPIKPVLFHGDFAPWNIRVIPSPLEPKWVVLDWERGVRQGLPGWDWFHYFVQYNTLVRHASPQTTLSDIEALWEEPGFLAYAKKTGIQGMLKELTFLYLLYLLRFHSPRDKTRQARHLLQAFKERYFSDVVLSQRKLKISVVTPSYKQLPWLKLCVASIADQEGVAVEHIIQDAQTGPDLEAWIRTHAKSQLYVEADTGMYDAINRGFARASGDIVCWLNSDEQYLEGTLAKVTRFFETHPDIDVLFGDAILVDNKGDLLSYRRTVAPKLHHIQASHLNVLSCATFVRHSVLDRGYLLNTRWKTIADAVWVADLLEAGVRMAVINEPLSVFTITDANLGQSSIASSEAKLWREETSSKASSYWLRPYFVLQHRFTKLFHGAYWPRSIAIKIYTLASPKKRVCQEARHLGFFWPRA